jgi:hypothetical protein
MAAVRTRWNVVESEGFDAIAFLGPLSGQELYRRYYSDAADRFGMRLPDEVRADIPRLAEDAANSSFGLLWPVLANILSGAGLTTLPSVIAALRDLEGTVRPAYVKSAYSKDSDFDWLRSNSSRLLRVFLALQQAGFESFRRERLGADFHFRMADVQKTLANFDVIYWQEKLTGRRFDPIINVVLLAFSKPHGAKMQDQTFLQAVDYDVATTVRIAAHEMLHPPFPMNGAAAKAALEVLARDALITRIVRDHDPKWGYTSLDALLDEDLCEAVDQVISEALGVERSPAERWLADDGMHVLAAGLYGLLKQDRWNETGGNLERWIAAAAASGRLAPEVLHPAAAKVLQRPVNQLWPLASRR